MSVSWLSSLRGRLVMWYVAVLVLALALFGAAAVIVIDRDFHATLDARLKTTAEAVRNFVDVGDGSVAIDEHDRQQILALLGSQTEVAVVGGSTGVVFSSSGRPSSSLMALTQSEGLSNLRQGDETTRALALPVDDGGKRIGTVLAWTTTTWIAESDRRVAAAFALAALLLAAVGSIAGTAVTRRALEDAFARQRRFTAGASHELRAPLSVIRAEADLALRAPRDDASYHAALATIAAEADRMEKLVGALLSAARAEHAGKRSLVDLQELARRVCSCLQPTADAKQAAITIRETATCRVLADSDALESAVMAVLHNAVKYTPAGGSIEVWTECSGRSAELFVRDGGPGFPPEALRHGLEYFWRGDSVRSNGATGLGLAIANSIARASGGRMTLANAPNGGAQVLISLPAR